VETTGQPPAETPEYDEDGRRFVFRYRPVAPAKYHIDRERLFSYLATHRVPGVRQRSIRRDRRNAVNFYEDVRELQTHAEVIPAAQEREDQLTQLRLRSAS
jgi:hypothetical protein